MTLYIFYEVNTSKVHCAIILIEYIWISFSVHDFINNLSICGTYFAD